MEDEHFTFLQHLFPSPTEHRPIPEAGWAMGRDPHASLVLARWLEGHGYILVGAGGHAGKTPKGTDALNAGRL